MSQQINLFNPIFLKQKKIFASVPMVRALGLLLVGVALLVVYGSQNVATLERRAAEGATRLSQQQARMATVNTEYAPRQPSKELGVELAVAEAHLRALRDVSAVLARGDIGNTAGYSAYFKALARQNVEGMWLTGVSIVGAGNEIGVQGRALDAKLVPQFITRLANEPALRGKSFAALSIERPPPTPAVPPAPGSPAATALAASSSGATAGRAAPAPALAGPTPSPFVDFSLQSLAQAPAGGRK